MLTTVLGRLLGALGALAVLLYVALRLVAPELPGSHWLAATAGVGLSAWVYLDWLALERFFASRGGREQVVSWALIVVVFGIGGLLLHMAEREPTRWDYSEGRMHSLDVQSEAMLRDLPADVAIHVVGYYVQSAEPRASAQRRRFEGLVAAAKGLHPGLSFEVIDPDLHPVDAARDDVTSNGTVVVRMSTPGAAEAGATAGATTGGATRSERLYEPDEGELINAVLRLARDRRAKVYFVTGHGERTPQTPGDEGLSKLVSRLQAVGFGVGIFDTIREAEVPDDASLIVLAAPRVPLSEAEAGVLERWVEGGGGLLVGVEPRFPGEEDRGTGLEDALGRWGLQVHNDLILDEVMRRAAGDPTFPLSTEFGYHEITSGLNVPLLQVTARSVGPTGESSPEDITVFELARTSEASWGETNIDVQPVTFDEGDRPGPMTMAVLAELHRQDVQEKLNADGREADGARDGKVLLVGDVDWMSDLALGEFGNMDFALRSVAYLAAQEDLVKIPPKERRGVSLQLEFGEQILLILLAVLVMPGGAALMGLIVFVWRRSL